MHIVKFPEFLQFNRHRWNKLLVAASGPPDLSPEWCEALIFAHNISPNDVVVLFEQSDNDIDWLMPVVVEENNESILRLKVIRPLLNAYSLHFSILSRKSKVATISSFFEIIRQFMKGWDLVTIDKLIESSLEYDALVSEAIGNRLQLVIEEGKRPPILSLETSWRNYLSSKSANFRYNLKRKEKKLQAEGQYEIIFNVDCSSYWESIFSQVVEIDEASWKVEAGTSLKEFEKSFYWHLILADSSNFQSWITILYLDELPIAYDLSIVSNGVGYCLKTSYRSAYGKLSPGIVLRYRLLERLFGAGVFEYDFLGHDESYKREWSTSISQEVGIKIYSRSFKAQIRSGIDRALKSFRKA